MVKNLKAVKHILNELNYVLNRGQKKGAVFVFFVVVFRACFELLGVAAIVPFLQAMINVEELMDKKYIQIIMHWGGIYSEKGLLSFMSLGLIVLYVVKNMYILFANYIQYDYSTKVKKSLSINIMKAYMSKPYTYFLDVSSAEIVRTCNADTMQVYNILSNILFILSELLTIIMIGIFIMGTEPVMSLEILILMFVMLLFIIGIFKPLMKRAGTKSMQAVVQKDRAIYQAILGIKEVFVTQRQEYFIKAYETAAEDERKLNRRSEVINLCPDRIVEGVCVSGLIGIVSVKLIADGNVVEFLPTLGAFAMAAFKLLPSIGKISSRANSIVYSRAMLSNVYQVMQEANLYREEQKKYAEGQGMLNEPDKLEFQNTLTVEHVVWQYANQKKPVLTDACLEIKKGDSIGLIGESGAGKTTLGDIILGLLKPNQGNVLIDGLDVYAMPKSWARIVGYVPQAVFLADDTVRNNIKFGLDADISNDKLVWEALERAQLRHFVESLPDGLETIVGERGIKFSGGQRQRIAIARALYAKPEILVLDEATAALDNETEKAVMESIDALQGQITLIIVAHRLTTIRNCDKIYEVKNGIIIEKNKEDIFI